MRRLVMLWSLVGYSSVVLAIPSRQDKTPSGPPLSAQEAEAFAGQLKKTIDFMVQQYARPVQRAELVTAALKRLYQAAGRVVPSYLTADVKKADADDNRLEQLILQTRLRLGNVNTLQGAKALEVGLWSALKALDPYSFLTTDGSYTRASSSEREGTGLELDLSAGLGPPRVKSVIPGSPAQRAGLRPGDLITHLNDLALKDKTAAQTLALWQQLTGVGQNRAFPLVIQRPGAKQSRKLRLEPRPFKADTVMGVRRNRDNSWDYFLDPKRKIAYVRLDALKLGTAADLEQVLRSLKKAGAAGLILDLRWCPGGLLDEAVEASCLLVGDQTIATINYRDGKKYVCTRRQTGGIRPASSASFLDFPLLVLVNGATRGGGELIAAAVQDSHRGGIAGQRTIGKGSVQNALRNEQGAIYYPVGNMTIRLSVGIFVRSTGKNLQRFADSKRRDDWGVRPDARLEFAVSEGLSEKLHDWYQLKDLRPGWSDDALPLDDPDNDAQLQFGVQALQKRMAKQRAAK